MAAHCVSMTFTALGTYGEYQHRIKYEELPTPIKVGLNETGSRALVNYITFATPQANRDYARVYSFESDPIPITNIPPSTAVYYWRRIS